MKRARETLGGLLDYLLGRTELKKQLADARKGEAEAREREADARKGEADARKGEADARKRTNFSIFFSLLALSCTLDFTPVNPTTKFELFVPACKPALFLDFLVLDRTPCSENSRTQAAVESIWGGLSAYAKAHLIPLSYDCGMEWIDIFALLLLEHNTEENAKILMFGFEVDGSKIRSAFSGLVHNAINFLGLPHQLNHLDESSSILFVPILTAREILNWSGQPYKCLIIAKDAIVMDDIGFSAAAQKASSDYFCEMDSHSDEVCQGFKELKELLLMIIMYLKTKELKFPDKSSKSKKCKLLREFLKGQTDIPWFDVKQIPSMVVVCLNFIGTEIQYPPANRPGQTPRTHHRSCPHPFLLVLRSCNSYFNMLDALHLWPAWDQYLADPSREVHRQTPLILLPSCRDCHPHAPDCLYCMAESILLDPEAYPDLSDAEYEAAKAVLVRAQATDADVDSVAGVRNRAFAADAGERKGSDGGSAATGSS